MLIFYVPCPDKDTAHEIAKALLTEKKVSCANILPAMESVYWWEGQLESSNESVLILKTADYAKAQEIITRRIEELHPYKVPCIMTLPVLGINESYKKWLEESLK